LKADDLVARISRGQTPSLSFIEAKIGFRCIIIFAIPVAQDT